MPLYAQIKGNRNFPCNSMSFNVLLECLPLFQPGELLDSTYFTAPHPTLD
jgi:hypothetical protein